MLCSSYYSHNNFQGDIKLTKRIFSFSWYPLTLGLGHRQLYTLAGDSHTNIGVFADWL